ncbi:MAG TPA: hypothetical protein VG276_30935 [Actinomycetes bacterium]|jgi:hypothetical protein|nr:hypothetical protein [Actinomycetes bacterium]
MSEPIHERLLHRYVERALLAQNPRKRPAMARLVADPRTRRIVAVFDADDDGRPVPGSLAYRVDLLARDGWATLARIHWTLLGLEWADVTRELDSTLRQHAEGTYPGGEHDQGRPAGLN